MKECKPSFEKCIIDRCPYYHEFIEIVSGDVHMRIRCEKQDIPLTKRKEEERRMRLIDANALLKHKTDHDMISTHLIYNTPTIDAVPVIRCKDCKWYSANTGYHWGRCENYRPFPFDETDYCSRAERKEECGHQ